jgi:hypothetical protein
MRKLTALVPTTLLTFLVAAPALAQTAVAPPADLKEVVGAPKDPALAPPKPFEPPTDGTHAALSAGGQYAAGNSKLFAASILGKFDIRRGANAFAMSIIGNYAEAFFSPPGTYTPGTGGSPGTITPGAPGAWYPSTDNLQIKLRYDRYLTSSLSLFFQATGLHDPFQAISFRVNLDPGVKLIFLNHEKTKIWGELGYDFQADDNNVVNGFEQQPGSSGPIAVDAMGLPYVIHGSDTIHSSRVFAGVQHAFNKEVTLNFGLEYLQGFGGSGGGTPAVPTGINPVTKTANIALFDDLAPISLTAARLNFDALLAAHLFGGLSLGVGFNVKYNSEPLPGKVNVDSSGTVSLIYAYSSVKKVEPKKCPCPDEGPPGSGVLEAPPPPPPFPPSGMPSAPVAGPADYGVAPPPPPPPFPPSPALPPPPPPPPAPPAHL